MPLKKPILLCFVAIAATAAGKNTYRPNVARMTPADVLLFGEVIESGFKLHIFMGPVL